jgi:hypothetical protein
MGRDYKFNFGSLAADELWAEGDGPLERARPPVLKSITGECKSNDGGVWWAEYCYVAQQPCDTTTHGGKWQFKHGDPNMVRERCDNNATNQLVRDAGHGGMTLADFCAAPEAVAAKLTLAEVAMLRLYTGPLFQPLNRALRSGEVEPIQEWWTCLSVLVCAVFKLSFAPGGKNRSSVPRFVYRGLSADSLGAENCVGGLDFAKDGGVELAFCSTTTDREVAERYSGGKIVMGFELSSTTRAASMQWLSQYPSESEWLLPPFTALSPKSSSVPAAVGHATELTFVATVRVPFRELNLRVTRLQDPPRVPRRDILTLALSNSDTARLRWREAYNSTVSPSRRTAPQRSSLSGGGRPELDALQMENDLEVGRVDAGIAALQRGFFGGCGLWAIIVYIGFSIFPGSLCIAFWSDKSTHVTPGSSGPVSAFVMGLSKSSLTVAAACCC